MRGVFIGLDAAVVALIRSEIVLKGRSVSYPFAA